MVTGKSTKAAEKSQVCRKLTGALQKLYGRAVPKLDLPVLETMLFAVCLEDNGWTEAETGYRKLLGDFFDLNEIRVSSVSELEASLQGMFGADWKGLRIRSILRNVFESTYSFDLEKIRRLTLDAAIRQLKKVPYITPFIRDFTLHQIIGAHVLPLDDSMLNAARWLGLVPLTADIDAASEFLKGGVRKSDVPEFCHLLRCVSTDARFRARFAEVPEEELDLDGVLNRLTEVQSPPKKKTPKKPEKPAPRAASKAATKTEPAAKAAPAKAAPAKTAPAKAASARTPAASASTSKSAPKKAAQPAARKPVSGGTGAKTARTGERRTGSSKAKKSPARKK